MSHEGITAEAEAFHWTFRTDCGTAEEREATRRMLDAVKRFVSSMQRGEKPHFLSLLGVSGLGKTHLAKRITAFFEKHCAYFTEPRTGARIARRGGFKSWRRVADEMAEGDFSGIPMLADDWFVALDDVFSEHKAPSGLSVSKLDYILSERSERRWTVVTANLSLRAIAESDTRIASRLKRGGSVVVQIPSLRDFCYREEGRES